MDKFDFNPEVHFSLRGETVFVTGAGGQLGSNIVSGLIASKANVIATDMKLDHLEKCAVKHGWDNEKVLLKDCDIRIKDSIVQVLNEGKNIPESIVSVVEVLSKVDFIADQLAI